MIMQSNLTSLLVGVYYFEVNDDDDDVDDVDDDVEKKMCKMKNFAAIYCALFGSKRACHAGRRFYAEKQRYNVNGKKCVKSEARSKSKK
jgi:hypothetical protein